MSDKSRSKQETMLLEERIEKIRKKNEEIKRRHLIFMYEDITNADNRSIILFTNKGTHNKKIVLWKAWVLKGNSSKNIFQLEEEREIIFKEVEADKQNAAKLNALVQITSPSEDWPIGGRSFSPPPSHNQGTSRQRRMEPYKLHQNNGSNGSSAKTYCFGEGDGPPPDPKYKFLADSERDSQKNNSDRRQSRPHRGRGGSREIPRDRQCRVVLQKPQRESEQPHPEYDAWRAERIRIDNDRISRQKTAEGQWRREWDHEKITQEEDERFPARGSKDGGPRRSNNWSTNIDQRTNQNYNTSREHLGSHMYEKGRRGHGSGTHRVGRGNLRGRRVVQPQQESSTSINNQLPSTNQSNVGKNGGNTPLNAERNVVSIGESIKISVPNDTTSIVKRVKVNAPVVGGTGRVGPRQKIRVSYSSQSEDETPHTQTVEMCSTRINVLSDSATPNHSASSKPPLPPSSGYKSEAPKPRRQRVKRTEHTGRGGRKDSDNADESTDKNDDSERGNESGGDDSWEDVTTTSGNESACEEMSPHYKIVPDITSDEKLETSDGVSNSQSSVDVTQLEEKDEASIPQESKGYDEQSDDVQSETGDEIKNNLIDTVIKCNSFQSVTVNESAEENVHNETESTVSEDVKNECKSEENSVTHESSEENPQAVQV